MAAGNAAGNRCCKALQYDAFSPAAAPAGPYATLKRRMPLKDKIFSLTVWKTRVVLWIGAILVGLLAAFFAWSADGVEAFRDGLFERFRWLPLVLTPFGLMVAVWITRHWAPGARGSGIPQAVAALQNPDDSYRLRLLSFPIVIWKLLLTLVGLLCGASIGREGPTVHIGAAIMFRLGRLARFPHHLLERGLILAGGAAGISAAFNTPIAGIMFAIEEMARSFEERSSGAVITAVVLAGVIAIAIHGNYTYFGHVSTPFNNPADWYAVFMCGVVGGLAGGLFSETLIQGSRRLVPLIKRAPLRFAFVSGLLIAVIGLLTDGATFGTGYHHASEIVTGSGESQLLFPLLKLVTTWLSYFTGIPGGIFAPTLATGAGFGADLALLMPDAEVTTVVLLGMVAYFTGVVQTPITAAVIVMEMTANQQMVLPILATAFLAVAVSKLVCRNSVYWALAEDLLVKYEERKQSEGDETGDPELVDARGEERGDNPPDSRNE